MFQIPRGLKGATPRVAFAPGNSGRPKGARSRLITELEQAMELAAPEIVRILIGRAQCGDGSMEAAKYILERIAPSRRGRLVEIEGFEVRTPADVPAALASLATAIGDGTITIEEATGPAVCCKRSWTPTRPHTGSPKVYHLARTAIPNSGTTRIRRYSLGLGVGGGQRCRRYLNR